MRTLALCLAAVTSLAGCEVAEIGDGTGDDPDVISSDEAGAGITWSHFSSTCGSVGSPVGFGANLSVLPTQQATRSDCSISGRVHIPDGVRLIHMNQYMHFAVFAETTAPVSYVGTLGGLTIGSGSAGSEEQSIYLPNEDISSIGHQLCARGGDLALNFTATLQVQDPSKPLQLDSVDFNFPDVARCNAGEE